MGEAHRDVKVENAGSEPSQAYTDQASASEGEASPFPYSHENHLPRVGERIGTFRTLRRHLTLADEDAVAMPDKEVRSALRSDSGSCGGHRGGSGAGSEAGRQERRHRDRDRCDDGHRAAGPGLLHRRRAGRSVLYCRSEAGDLLVSVQNDGAHP
jgi:hypothetical protein